MDELFKLVLLLLAEAIGGFINIMAGGGATLTLPLLIFLDGKASWQTALIALLCSSRILLRYFFQSAKAHPAQIEF